MYDGQISIFEYGRKEIAVDKTIRLIELFAGYGSQAMALRNIGAEFEHYKVVEFDKYALNSYNEVHGTNFPVIDIRDFSGKDLEIVERDMYTYILTYSFPCTDLSLSGKQAGMKKGSGTRSGLLWEVERILDESEGLPDILLMENVPQVISKKNIDDFKQWQQFLEKKGYKNHTEILNAKDYGVPQNRRRCFMVSILGDFGYHFPDPIPLEISAQELLEQNVDEKYYMPADRVKALIRGRYTNAGGTEQRLGPNTKNLCNPLTTVLKDNVVLISQATKTGYIELELGGIADLSYPNSKTRRGRVTERGNVCPTITTSPSELCVVYNTFSLRRLTPRECGRYMGVTENDIDKMYRANSETQLYKQYGNSIVVKCLESVFRNLNIKGVKSWNEYVKEGEDNRKSEGKEKE